MSGRSMAVFALQCLAIDWRKSTLSGTFVYQS